MADITQISGSGSLNISTGTKITKTDTGASSTGNTAEDKAKQLKTQFMSILLTQMQHQNPLGPDGYERIHGPVGSVFLARTTAFHQYQIG